MVTIDRASVASEEGEHAGRPKADPVWIDKDLYPWTGNYFDVGGGVRMHYLDEGPKDAEVLVMLHGNPTWSFYWRHLVADLSKHYRVIVPDHVGCGLSDKPGDDRYDYVLQRRVEDVEKLLASLSVTGNVTLVLHDWGGMIGMAYATRNPERVKRLVVLNTAGFGLPEGRKLPWQIALVRFLPFFSVPVRGFNAFSVGATMTCSTVKGRMTKAVKRGYLAPYDSWKNRIAVHRFVQDIPLKEGDRSWPLVKQVSDNLERLWANTPLLVLWGEQDFVFDEHFLGEWKRRLPHGEVHTFPEAGHYVVEDAHEKIVPLMRTFLDRHPLSTAKVARAAAS
jgi:haloalkane dehalogenase